MFKSVHKCVLMRQRMGRHLIDAEQRPPEATHGYGLSGPCGTDFFCKLYPRNYYFNLQEQLSVHLIKIS